jgi:hypothetical protein
VSNHQWQSGNKNINAGSDYVGGDKAGRDINKNRNIRISLSFLAIAAVALGGYVGIKTNWLQILVQTNPSNSSTATPSPQQSISKSAPVNQFDKVSFPKESCGDELPKTTNSYPVSVYPVFIKYTEINWNTIKSNYCKDALLTEREGNGEKAVQVASFTSKERAQEFKDFMVRKLGSGDIGKASVISKSPDSIQAEPSPPTSNTIGNQPGFQSVLINCRNTPSAKKFMDLEFSGCQLIYGRLVVPVKNYSADWYEVIMRDGSAGLVSPGMEAALPLNPKGHSVMFCIVAPNDPGCHSKTPLQESIQIKQHSGNPSRTVTVACNDSPRNVWGLTIKPHCNSKGSYIDIESEVQHSTELKLSNGNISMYNPSLGGSTGYVTSNSRTVTFTLTIR